MLIKIPDKVNWKKKSSSSWFDFGAEKLQNQELDPGDLITFPVSEGRAVNALCSGHFLLFLQSQTSAQKIVLTRNLITIISQGID